MVLDMSKYTVNSIGEVRAVHTRGLVRWDERGRRRLVLVDVENLVGGAVVTAAQAWGARRLLEQAMPDRPGDQVILGVSHASVLESGLAWGESVRRVVRSGENGADLALLQVLEEERVADRFGEVVVVSGDGIFTDAVSRLGAAGVGVTVVAHADGCAKRLSFAAGRTVYLQRALALGGVA